VALIASINGVTRRVYLDAAEAIDGVLTFHPTADLYAAYKALRAADESARPFDAFMKAEGNLPKGGGKFTPRFTMLLAGTKVVIPAGVTEVNVTGELLTDDGSKPFDTALVTGPCIINYQPAEAEVIKLTASGNEYSLAQIAAAVAPAVWLHILEAGLSAEAIQRIQLAALVGKTAGIGGASETYFAQDGTTPRVVAGFDQDSNRTSVVLDGDA
jgi:hypothetical protein